MDDAYNILLSKKNKNESFSEVIRRLAGKKKDIMMFAGSWKDVDVEKIKKNIEDIKKRSTLDLINKKNDMYRF